MFILIALKCRISGSYFIWNIHYATYRRSMGEKTIPAILQVLCFIIWLVNLSPSILQPYKSCIACNFVPKNIRSLNHKSLFIEFITRPKVRVFLDFGQIYLFKQKNFRHLDYWPIQRWSTYSCFRYLFRISNFFVTADPKGNQSVSPLFQSHFSLFRTIRDL